MKRGSRLVIVVLILTLLQLAFLPAIAQKEKLYTSNLILEGRFHCGFMIPHHIEMHIFNSHFPAYEVSLIKLTYGKMRWQYMYNYPMVGVSLWHSPLGNSPYMGSGTGLFPFVNFPLNQNLDTRLFLKVGIGLGYIDNPFHRTENYKNIAIGSHLNACANFNLEIKQKLGKRFLFSGGISFTHFSNGSMKTPNYGINIPAVNLALAYRLQKENPYLRKKLLPELYPFEFDGKKYFYIYVTGAGGVKDMQAEAGKPYPCFTIFTNVLKYVSYKSKLGFGLDLSYDGSDNYILERNGEDAGNQVSLVKGGFNVAYDLEMDRLSIVMNLGLYMFGKEGSDGNIYQKIAFRYMWNELLYSDITLRAHAGRADFIAFGLGYKFSILYY